MPLAARSVPVPRAHVPPGKPWGTINLVADGNAWTGMDLPILPGDSSRTSAATLLAAQAAGQLPPLPDRVLDARTEIRLHGCALGLIYGAAARPEPNAGRL